MKNIFTLVFLIFQASVNGQNLESDVRLLNSLDWSMMSCERTDFVPQEKCQLTITNNTRHPLQGYWLNWYGQAVKVKFAKIEPKSTKTIHISTKEYWIFADENLNAIGIYEPLDSASNIVIEPSDLEDARKLPRPITDKTLPGTPSGGDRLQEQLAYDVLTYDLLIEIFPDQKFIEGSNTIISKVMNDLDYFVFDLDTLLEVKQVSHLENEILIPLSTTFRDDKYWARLPETIDKGSILTIVVQYSGHPREATQAPYQGGFSWNRTEGCQPWIASSCQVDGADLWYPCKDYQWDEPDSVNLSFTVPKGLKAISNGVFVDSLSTAKETTTFRWKVQNPINNYNIALNIAPY